MVTKVLDEWVEEGATPGYVAMVGDEHGVVYAHAGGHYTYGKVPPMNAQNMRMDLNTMFDMASCTKVSGATNAVAQFYQRGELDLHTPVARFLGAEYAQNGKGRVTVLNCLLHNAGYPPDPDPNYWDPAFGCPETREPQPAENFSCLQRIWNGLMAQKLANPVGAKYVYSDLSFITLQYVVGKLARDLGYVRETDLLDVCSQIDASQPYALGCYFEAYLRLHVYAPLAMTDTMFLPPRHLWPRCAPAENDTVYLHRVIQGQVSDGNAYALGGIAGHAGLFSTALDMFKMMHHLVFPDLQHSPLLNRTTVDFFTREYNHSQSSRALGWNTNDPTVFDYGWDLACGKLSAKTFMHLGYTGTQLCGDPVRRVFTILLTNRVYPTSSNIKIRLMRKAFNDQVVDELDKRG